MLSGQIGQVGAHAVLTSSLVLDRVSGPILTAQEHNVQGVIEFTGLAGDVQMSRRNNVYCRLQDETMYSGRKLVHLVSLGSLYGCMW